MSVHPSRTTFRFLAHFFRSTPRRAVAAVGLLGIAGLLEGVGVASLIPLLQLADRQAADVQGPGRYLIVAIERMGLEPSFAVLLAVLFVAVLLKSLLFWFAMTQVGTTQIHFVRELRLRLVRAMLRARWGMFASQRAGAWANALATESTHSGGAYREGCEVIAAAFPITMYVILAALMSWRVTLFALASGILLFFLLRGFLVLSRRSGNDHVRVGKRLASTTVDVVQGMKPIKAMAREDLIEPVFARIGSALDDAQRRTMLAAENLRFFQEPTLTLLLAISIYVLFRIANLPLPTVIVIAFMFYRILQHLNTVQGRLQHLAVGEASFWSLMERIEETEAEREVLAPGASPGPLRQGIRFDRISFAYGERPVLTDLSLTIPAGRFVAIEGESGSGKTTLADLLGGLFVPSAGRILVDGRDLATLDLREWRSEIGYVPQEMLLLGDSIRNNVSLGDPSITEADVERALRLAGAWDFVARAPGGLDAEVGERGMMFSGGQRQRIALARALVTRPTLLILDEVTTALDPATEAEICATLRTLTPEVTIFAISHQAAMHQIADETYRMSDGRLTPLRDAAVLRA